ncbi:hypothetical protein [Luteimonas kalidii]|uniref:Uncharacterized protein n=1 Tax=Luteimonas kalidii TaxID=3042025 RepID=A0ABT6JY83_9GAMM|nr:hypothetical protein [Luteimonas kalidii]MDH5835111.1 hypothetical protein [Luteimonas kalidii]
MSFLKLFAAGALGFVAYRTWQRRQLTRGNARLQDDGQRTAPHGDPVLVGERLDVAPAARTASHSSRGFGEP